MTFDVTPDSTRALSGSRSANEIAIAFGPPGVALGGQPLPATPATPSVIAHEPPGQTTNEYAPLPGDVPVADAVPPPPLGAPVQVTSIDLAPEEQSLNVRIGVSGPVGYEWHRLADNRWFIDLQNATLATPARDEQPHSSAVLSVRVRQLSPAPDPVVRIAFTLASPRRVDVTPSTGGFNLAVNTLDDLQPQRSGSGRIASGAVIATAPSPALTAPDLWSSPGPSATPSHLPVPTNPKLIVIDPGHGGSDSGAAHNGLTEKDLTLDISRRLRAILLARGWQVKMTRDADTDVFQPNDSARDELQARCDIANNAGARFFVSVHINSYTSDALNGTTTYYYKSGDAPFAEAIHRRLAGSAGTADRGLRKEDFYVIRHTDMPSALIETAFLSNAGDAALLHSPAFLQRIAIAIADGIGDYATNAPFVSPSATDGS